MSNPDRRRDFLSAHDGPIAPAELAAARWGPGAGERIARGADAAHLEARLRQCLAALGRLRFAGWRNAVASEAAQRLVSTVAHYRRVARANSFAS